MKIVGKIFKQALKMERDYQRIQYRIFKDRQREIEQQWMNKKASIERFFYDKYEMISAGSLILYTIYLQYHSFIICTIEISDENARQKFDEIQLRLALRRAERDLKIQRKKKLKTLRDKLVEQDRRQTCFIEPDQILERLLKISVD